MPWCVTLFLGGHGWSLIRLNSADYWAERAHGAKDSKGCETIQHGQKVGVSDSSRYHISGYRQSSVRLDNVQLFLCMVQVVYRYIVLQFCSATRLVVTCAVKDKSRVLVGSAT